MAHAAEWESVAFRVGRGHKSLSGLVVGAGPKGARIAGQVARMKEERGAGAEAVAICSDAKALAGARPAKAHQLGEGSSPEAAKRSLEEAADALESCAAWNDPNLPLAIVVDEGEKDGVAVAVDALTRRWASRRAAILSKPWVPHQKPNEPLSGVASALSSRCDLLTIADQNVLAESSPSLTAKYAMDLTDSSLSAAAIGSLALLSPAVPWASLLPLSTARGEVCRPCICDSHDPSSAIEGALCSPFLPPDESLSSLACALGGRPLGVAIKEQIPDDVHESLSHSLVVGAGSTLPKSQAVVLASCASSPVSDPQSRRLSEREWRQVSKIASASAEVASSSASPAETSEKAPEQSDGGLQRLDANAQSRTDSFEPEEEPPDMELPPVDDDAPEDMEFGGGIASERGGVWERALRVIAEDRRQQVRNASRGAGNITPPQKDGEE